MMSLTSENDGETNDNCQAMSAETEMKGPAPTATSTTKPNTASSATKSRKSKKRSRKDMGPETQAEIQLSLKQDRYDKLLYMAKKQLMKQAKQVRAFMVQRNIRKLKRSTNTTKNHNDNNEDEDSDDDDDNNKNNNKSEDKAPLVQASLQPLKDLSLDLVVNQAMRQLGLFHANPTPGSVEPPKLLPPEQAKLVSSVLDHKRFQSCLEEWNEKVADFRRFCLLLDDRNNKFSQDNSMIPRKGKKSKTTTTSLRPQDHQPTSFFCTSLNDENDEEGETDMMAYGPAAAMDDMPKPKNRRGQRARKAKALALQAKKEGRQYESLNWRQEKKAAGSNNDDDKNNNKKNGKDQEKKSSKQSNPTKPKDHHATASTTKRVEATTTKPTVEDLASNHPSWAAKQQQKSGIVAFQGKKITFD